ncbi:MAG TPA: pyruvate carboxylase [Syntrophales bacterium]|nr:pyruvate carboxylase [Syntrophales bacterium]HOM06971.1 pyruvate carboxylase [Syntrophales bacterium]HPC00909.1 pyruvate carboxylase [Syntrophales bacterium]HPQ06511.1 pyruvate carboxylase [Syntrophales bacterium]
MMIHEGRITPRELTEKGVAYILEKVRRQDGYYLTNTERDLSQSDFKNRIMPHTQLLVAQERNDAGYFSLEISGGASVHVDMLRKQINPLEKLQVLQERMPDTLFQTLCRGINLFGYRPYPENVIRLTVRAFARYVHVWRVFDFLNYIPNMVPVFEEVKAAGCILEPSICFSTGPEHTDEFYVRKVGEILDVTGPDIILCIKNHGGLGTPKRIGDLVRAILAKYPDLIIHYHGHNTDGADLGRIVEAVRNGAKIVDASDHAFTGFYGPPPLLTAIDVLEDYGYKAVGINRQAVIDTSNKLRPEREYYRDFESQFLGFDPSVQIHKLPGGATGSSFEQAVKGGFLHRMPEILQRELPRVQVELGNWWSVTPGSQILWTTAVNNVLKGQRYKDANDDLKNLMLGRYGEFPFYRPADEIYHAVFGDDWKRIVECDTCYQKIEDVDLEVEKKVLEHRIGRPATEEELVLYLQHPNDAVDFFKFEAKYGKTWVLPPKIWFRRGGFNLGEKFEIPDAYGRLHSIEIGPQRKTRGGETVTYLIIDHHPEPIVTEEEEGEEKAAKKKLMSPKEIEAAWKMGDIRAHVTGTVNEVAVEMGEEVSVGQVLVVLEAMKMLNNIVSEVSGKVSEISVSPGDKVTVGDKLLFVTKE